MVAIFADPKESFFDFLKPSNGTPNQRPKAKIQLSNDEKKLVVFEMGFLLIG